MQKCNRWVHEVKIADPSKSFAISSRRYSCQNNRKLNIPEIPHKRHFEREHKFHKEQDPLEVRGTSVKSDCSTSNNRQNLSLTAIHTPVNSMFGSADEDH